MRKIKRKPSNDPYEQTAGIDNDQISDEDLSSIPVKRVSSDPKSEFWEGKTVGKHISTSTGMGPTMEESLHHQHYEKKRKRSMKRRSW